MWKDGAAAGLLLGVFGLLVLWWALTYDVRSSRRERLSRWRQSRRRRRSSKLPR